MERGEEGIETGEEEEEEGHKTRTRRMGKGGGEIGRGIGKTIKQVQKGREIE